MNDTTINPHQERKDFYRAEHDGKMLQDMIAVMHNLQKAKVELDEKLKEINAELDVLRLELIPAKMEAEGIERISIAGIGRVSLTGDMHVRVVNQGEFYNWLHDNKLDDLIKETVAPSTLKAFAKARMKDGKQLPESISVSPFTRASITKA